MNRAQRVIANIGVMVFSLGGGMVFAKGMLEQDAAFILLGVGVLPLAIAMHWVLRRFSI